MARARRVKRREGVVTPKRRIVVVSEGQCTEPSYLRAFVRIHGDGSARVHQIPEAGDPLAVVERAIRERKDSGRGHLGANDSFWAVFDRDDHPRFQKAVDLARGSGISLAISNPCFELWGIFHYEAQDGPIDRHQCQRKLEDLNPNYDRRSNKIFDDDDLIRESYLDAVERSRNALARRADEGNPEGNPSSLVHCLTEFIRCAPSQATAG